MIGTESPGADPCEATKSAGIPHVGGATCRLCTSHSHVLLCVFEHLHAAQVSRKLTFLYLANDVIQNSKRKGPEFTQDFAPVIVEAFKHVNREGEEGCKKQLGRVLSIWQERAVYENNLLEQLSQVLCKFITNVFGINLGLC
ncbi:Regulation of nuclear pre-mRNA domain-containing protein 1A [Ilyodon furcidens]|uniref:Regulation of nuclear pre-mRNA domain-containing protein 1A n=1 Tax=Ilyodon furcidens TaxID=33524 RepID=A0ABV0TB11_9TELE